MKLLGDRIFTTDYIDRQPLVGDDQYDKTAPCARNQPLWTETGRSPGTSLCLHCSIPCFLCHYCFHEIPRCMAVLKILRVHEHKTEQSLLRIKLVISRFQIKSSIDVTPKFITFFFPQFLKMSVMRLPPPPNISAPCKNVEVSVEQGRHPHPHGIGINVISN